MYIIKIISIFKNIWYNYFCGKRLIMHLIIGFTCRSKISTLVKQVLCEFLYLRKHVLQRDCMIDFDYCQTGNWSLFAIDLGLCFCWILVQNGESRKNPLLFACEEHEKTMCALKQHTVFWVKEKWAQCLRKQQQPSTNKKGIWIVFQDAGLVRFNLKSDV